MLQIVYHTVKLNAKAGMQAVFYEARRKRYLQNVKHTTVLTKMFFVVVENTVAYIGVIIQYVISLIVLK